jgi:hypothetical protein
MSESPRPTRKQVLTHTRKPLGLRGHSSGARRPLKANEGRRWTFWVPSLALPSRQAARALRLAAGTARNSKANLQSAEI